MTSNTKQYRIEGRDPAPPDVGVRCVEDALEAAMAHDTADITKSFPARPGYGTRGERVQLWANYVNLKINLDLKLHRYEIETSPTTVGKKLARLVSLFINRTQFSEFKADVVSDFKTILISRKDLSSLKGRTFNVSYFGEHETPSDVVTHQVRLNFQYTLPIAALRDYISSQQLTKHYPQKSQMLQSLNVFLNNYAKSTPGLIALGSNRTFPKTNMIVDLDIGLQGLRGYFASVRLATNCVLVNINVTHSAFFTDIPLMDLLNLFRKRFQEIHPIKPKKKNDKKEIIALEEKRDQAMLVALHYFLQKVSVMTKPCRGQTGLPIKTIRGLATAKDGIAIKKPNPHRPQVSKFGANAKEVKIWMDSETDISQSAASSPQSSGRYIPLLEHFQRIYAGMNVPIVPNMPVINVGKLETPYYLPATACKVIGGQPASSKLDDLQRQEMTKISIRPPMANASSIVSRGLETVGLNPNLNQKMKEWGFSADRQLITVQGHQLHKPTVRYASTTPQKVGEDASWNLLRSRFRWPKTIPKWTYLMLSPPLENEKIPDIMREFGKILQQTGIGMVPPTNKTTLSAAEMDEMVIKLDKYFRDTVRDGVKLIFVVLPSPNSPYYNVVKRLGDMKYGVATMCMNVKKLTKTNGQDQYLRNISMKVNLKIGGGNHVVGQEQLNLISPNDTIIVGIDVTHPSPGSNPLAPSIAAMVASVDSDLGQWPAALRIQNEARQEMVSGLKGMLESRVRLWETKNRKLPENILVYRDGVSEGQYSIVIDEELPALRKACQDIYGESYKEGHHPRLTIIVVGKRHHTRFYPTNPKNAVRNGNTKAGTVVDRGVTEGQNWDFFLQAHGPILGTARPAHQFVLQDEIFRSKFAKSTPQGYKNVADIVEEVTQALCYTFGRATRAVSVCTPAYYADLACERARRYFDFLYAPAAHGIAPDGATEANARPDRISVAAGRDVPIHANLKDSMFYI